MNYSKKLAPIIVTLLFFNTVMFAQANFTAWSGNFSGEGGSVCSSVGQIFYNSTSFPGGIITEGVQQPIEIRNTTGANNLIKLDINISVYPNPTIEYLFISIDNLKNKNLNYQLIDIEGRLISKGLIIERKSIIELTDLFPSTYLLKITDQNQSQQTFRIIKN